MFQPDEDGVFATVTASPVRRLFAYSMLIVLGGLLIYLALVQNPGVIWLILLIALGISVLVLAERLRQATRMQVELTVDGLRDSAGNILAPFDEIASVERGAFALKPSNGFTLVLKTRQPRAWAPGLYWRFGRRVGVGGVTAAGASKFMAEQISLRLKDLEN